MWQVGDGPQPRERPTFQGEERGQRDREREREREKEWLSGLELSAFLLKCFARTTQRRGDALACD